jgi:hypothetical protein
MGMALCSCARSLSRAHINCVHMHGVAMADRTPAGRPAGPAATTRTTHAPATSRDDD